MLEYGENKNAACIAFLLTFKLILMSNKKKHKMLHV